MINTLKITRKNDPNLWDVIGDKWGKTKANSNSRLQIESFWNTNELLHSGRLNDVINLSDRLSQFSIYGTLDFLIIENLSTSCKKTKEYIYNNEYKLLYKDISRYTGVKTNYLFPPKVFTNTVLPASNCADLLEVYALDVNNKNKSIKLAFDDKFNTLDKDFRNYVFTDTVNNVFLITYFKNSTINYIPLTSAEAPRLGSLKIKNKFELLQNKDFIYIEDLYSITIKFRDFKIINSIELDDTDLFLSNINLYSPGCFVLDNFNLEHFGKPIGFTETLYNKLLDSGESYLTIENKIFDIWKLNQRSYNFQQIYRLGSIISNEPFITSIYGKELLYDIDFNDFKAYTGKVKQNAFVQVLKFEDIPEILQPLFEYSNIEKDKYKILYFKDPYNNLGINSKDILFIDNKSYKIRKIFDNKYLELTTEVAPGALSRFIKILDFKTLKIYNLNSKNLFTESDTYIVNDAINNIYGQKSVSFGLKFGEFNWGDISYDYLKNDKCKFKTISIGNEYEFGDPLEKTIFIDYYKNNIDISYIQKALAINNKAFTQSNIEEYIKNNVLLIDNFLVNAYNYKNKFDNRLETEDEDILLTEDSIELTTEEDNLGALINYFNLTNCTTTDITKTKYQLSYKNMVFDNNGYGNIIYDSSFKNKTDYALLRGFIRVNSGAIKLGFSNTNDDFDSEFKMINIDSNKWTYFNIYINKNDFSTTDLYIVLKSVNNGDIKTDIDMFGLELQNSVFSFSEKLTDCKELFNTFFTSFDYKTINLL